MDPYSILGVSKTASQDEIKKAFRRIALQDHPDRNPDDPEAEERFKTASSAYELIGDPESRKEFDRSKKARRPNSPSPPPGFNDIFNRVNINMNFGQGNNTWEDLFGSFQSTHRRPFSIRARIDLTLEELVKNAQKAFIMDGQSISFSIPAGARDGMTIVVPLKNSQELHATINLLDHPIFTVRGDDLYCSVSIPVGLAVCGGDMNVKTIEGDIKLKIPPFTSSHKKLRVKNHGLFKADGTRGSVIYELKLDFDLMSDDEKIRLKSYVYMD